MLVAGIAALAAPGARAFPHAPGCVRVDAGGVPALRCGPAQGARAAIVLHGCGGGGGGPDPFPIWERVVTQAAHALGAHYRRVAAVGWSLGAGVAISTAEDRQPFDAIAAFSALAFPPSLARAGRLPPTIFLDGGAHDIVPPSNTRALYGAARRAHVPAAEFIYGNGTHNWPGAQGSAGIARAAAFLLRYLS